MSYRGAGLRHKIKRQKEWSFIFLHVDPPNNRGRGSYSATLLVRKMGRATDGWRFQWLVWFYVSVA